MSSYALPSGITFSRSLPSPPSPPISSSPLSSPTSPNSSPSFHHPSSGMIGVTQMARNDRSPAVKPMTAAERKRKNADAQAAFRQRRNEYIKKLEAAVDEREVTIKNLKDERQGMIQDNQGLRDENTRLQGKIDVLQATMKENDKLVKMLEKQLQAAQTQQQQQAHAQQQSSQSMSYEYGGLYAAPTGLMYGNQVPNSSFNTMNGMTMPIHNMSPDFSSSVSAPAAPVPPRGPHHISASTFGTPATGMRITTLAANVSEQAQVSQGESFHGYTGAGSQYEGNSNPSTGNAHATHASPSDMNASRAAMTHSPIEAGPQNQSTQAPTAGMAGQHETTQYTYTPAQQHQQAHSEPLYPTAEYPYSSSFQQQPHHQPQPVHVEHQQDVKPPTPIQPFRSAQALSSLNMDVDGGMHDTVALLKAQAFGKARRRRNVSDYDGAPATTAMEAAGGGRKRLRASLDHVAGRMEQQYDEEDG